MPPSRRSWMGAPLPFVDALASAGIVEHGGEVTVPDAAAAAADWSTASRSTKCVRRPSWSSTSRSSFRMR